MKSGMIFFLFLIPVILYQKKTPVSATYPVSMNDPAGPPRKGGPSIRWDTATLQRISPSGTGTSYPRMLQLMDGSLLVAYASSGSIVGQKSDDAGKSWSPPVVFVPKEDGVNMDTPDLLQLQTGRLLLCYGTRPQGALRGTPDTTKKFEIRLLLSDDGGQTWKGLQILHRAGSSFKDGCWEPSMVQLPGGEVQLFFADESPYTSSDEQNISLFRSSGNGASWTAEPEPVSFRKGSRDGMPVPIWLQAEKAVVVAIEDPGHRNFKPFTVRSAEGRWQHVVAGEDAARSYALADSLEDSIYAGAPYLRQLSTGQTVLSYQSTEGRMRNRDNDAVMRVAIGNAHSKDFRNPSTPFSVPEGYHALWNSLCILKGDVIIALTSTNGYSKGRQEIWMIKGTVEP